MTMKKASSANTLPMEPSDRAKAAQSESEDFDPLRPICGRPQTTSERRFGQRSVANRTLSTPSPPDPISATEPAKRFAVGDSIRTLDMTQSSCLSMGVLHLDTYLANGGWYESVCEAH